ncbi:variable surface protein [Plasmodium gonderi]|uniref:Variable surface protein n=1 Tax=Plasmodium gonderi TaxID=77519 RepID=A0A1Y1JRP3_PLAGO|nr:variable surface protein [Plasmodium gonderi]GAW84128.1 variable surface protein [Plasmodium gonderi]
MFAQLENVYPEKNKNVLFKSWDEAEIKKESVESSSILIKLLDEDTDLYKLGCLLYENYTAAKLLYIYKNYNNICDFFKEWLNKKISVYREKNKLCSKNKLLDNRLMALWEEKINAQADDDNDQRNWCIWEPSTEYYCYHFEIKKFLFDKNYRKTLIRYYMQKLIYFRRREYFSLDSESNIINMFYPCGNNY